MDLTSLASLGKEKVMYSKGDKNSCGGKNTCKTAPKGKHATRLALKLKGGKR
jgi:hypothetical protein